MYALRKRKNLGGPIHMGFDKDRIGLSVKGDVRILYNYDPSKPMSEFVDLVCLLFSAISRIKKTVKSSYKPAMSTCG